MQKILTCFKCRSEYHFANHCDAGEVALHVEVVGSTENIVLISGEMNMFTWETRVQPHLTHAAAPVWLAGDGWTCT